MEEYLSTTLNRLKTNNYAELNLVIGNESCDLDSAVSALVYASFMNWQYNQIKCKVCTRMLPDERTYKDDIFVPILMVDREDYPLKTEVAFCFKEHGIQESNLVFSNNIDMKQLVASRKTNIILVDHHILGDSNAFLAPFVTEIIDHRPRNKTDWHYKDDVRSTIECVGSCCTLVAQRIKDQSAIIAKDTEFFNAYPICSDILYSVIILDTVNFCKILNKATPHDDEMAQFLERVLKLDNTEDIRKSKLDSLVAARSDVSALSATQLLRKDLKIVSDVLVPSFPILVEEFLHKPEALEAVAETLKSRECGLALLLGMDLKGGLKRDGAIFSPASPNRRDSLAEFLQSWSKPPLELESVSAPNCFYFKQKNLQASRKQYMPAITQFLLEYRE